MDPTSVRRVLIVANQTAGGEGLRDAVLARALEWPSEFTLMVPATPPVAGWTWTEAGAASLAWRRMRLAMAGLRSVGVEVRGVIGDLDPVEAVGDAIRAAPFDEVLISTLAPGASRWLRQDLASRIRRRFGVPVAVVTATDSEAGRAEAMRRHPASVRRIDELAVSLRQGVG
jgi:hypothetical protein